MPLRKIIKPRVIKPYSIRRDGITQSILKKFMQCPKAGLYCIQGWEHRAMADRVRFGNICHHVNDQLYSSKFTGDASLIPAIIDQAIGEWEMENPPSTTGKNENYEIDCVKAEAVMNQYIRAYPSDFTGKMFVGAELVVNVEWMGFRLRGKIDGVYTDKNGDLWILETKTKGKIAEDGLLLSLALDFQNLFYLTLYEVMSGKTVKGILYNIIRNPGTKPHQGETLLAYKMRLISEVMKQRSYYFKRFELCYTDSDRERFQGELIEKLAMTEGILSGKLSTYHNETGCDRCDYLEMCVTGKTGSYIPKKLFNELPDEAE